MLVGLSVVGHSGIRLTLWLIWAI